ncbi:hypothetical protein [Delftia acidovorans]|uniref:hypothetical protein n=1 Tax=Delftia acidovorans TaxID=80866 RepID=UPI001EDFCD08|nr:hypothetical protein [Delftia acidovorans]MCG3784629.1 hypothetical protein [Delftia acidovorans]
MLIKKALAVVALTLSAGASHAWTLVYANDAAGNASAGSLQSLRTAVNNGANVKVLVTQPNVHTWGVKCTHTSVKMDATQAVVCLSDVGLIVDIGMGSQFAAVANPPQSMHFIINTSGQYAQANVNIGTGALVARSTLNYPMQWFVD